MTAASELRRADWRFLFPIPAGGAFRHAVLLGGPPALTDIVLRAGFARRVSREIPSKDSADALVLLEDARVDLQAASRCLCAGGAVYWEIQRRWTSALLTTPAAIRQNLLDAGLTPLALYWPRPGFGRVAMYLPVGPKGVFPWYVETQFQRNTAARRTGRLLLRGLVRRGGEWSYRWIPRFAVTAVFGPVSGPVYGQNTPTSLGIAPEAGSAPAVFLRGTDSYRRVILLPFSETSRQPTAVVKLWRLRDRNAHAEREQAVLGQIRSHLDAGTARTLPEPLGTVAWGESVAGVESYAPGRSLSQRIDEWGRPLPRKLDDLRLVFDWITRFHSQARVSCDPWTAAAMRRWVEEPCSRYRSAFGQRAEEARFFEALRQRAGILVGRPLPIVWAHPDLTGANIHVERNRIMVIDWSGAAPRLPLFDLLYFIVLVACRLRQVSGPSERLRCFRDLFLESRHDDPIVHELRQSVWRYLAALQIDVRFFPLLVGMNWVFRALDSFDRAEAVARALPGANPHPQESYVEYVRALAPESDRLLAQAEAVG